MHFMHEALAMGRVAVEKGEIPVGCVIVESCNLSGTNTIIARGSNETNESRNGTRHAEIVAVESLYSSYINESNSSTIHNSIIDTQPQISGVRINRSKGILSNCDLYVTCEPCIMCAAALSKLGIRKVYFGCHNERFGGNGSILSVHSDAYDSSNKKSNIDDKDKCNGGHDNDSNSLDSTNTTGKKSNSNTEIKNERNGNVNATSQISNNDNIIDSNHNENSTNGNTKKTMEYEFIPVISSHSYHKYEVEAGLLKDEVDHVIYL